MIALVTEAFGVSGGIAEYNRQLLSEVASLDLIEYVIVLPRRCTSSPLRLPPRIRQHPPFQHRVAYSLAAVRTAILEEPVHLIFCGHLYMAPLAASIALLARAPLWLHAHGIEAWTPLSQIYRRSVESAALVTSSSRYTRRRLLEWTDLASERARVLPGTVDPRFRPGPKPGYLLDRYGLRGKKVLITVARLDASEHYKGQDRVIRILPELLRTHSKTIYLIIGEGNDRPRLEELAKRYGVKDKVLFTGFVAAAELPDHLRLADVYVMPSTHEGFGIAFLEAMASGIDAIGGNCDGSVDPLGDGLVGKIVDPDNAAELVSAIRGSLDHPKGDAASADRFGHRFFQEHIDRLLRSLPLVFPDPASGAARHD